MGAERIEQHFRNVRKPVFVGLNKVEDAELPGQLAVKLAFGLALNFESKIQICEEAFEFLPLKLGLFVPGACRGRGTGDARIGLIEELLQVLS